MTEEEWRESTEVFQPLLHVRKFASVRKLRLIASAFAHWLQQQPGYEDARPCADIIAEVADNPKPFSELEGKLYALPGESWALSHVLASDNKVGESLNRLVFYAACSFNERSENPAPVHRMMFGLLSEVIGDPFHPASLGRPMPQTVVQLAQTIYEGRDFDRMPVLADAIEEAGCDNAELLSHLRGPGPHYRGCWALDLVLGKE